MGILPTCGSAHEDSEDSYESAGFLSGKRLLASMARSCGAHSRRVAHKAHWKSDEEGVRVAWQLQAAFLAQSSCRSVADGELQHSLLLLPQP